MNVKLKQILITFLKSQYSPLIILIDAKAPDMVESSFLIADQTGTLKLET